MPRRTLIPAAAAALTLLLLAAQAYGRPARASQGCGGAPNPSLHWNAVFGHATSTWQASLIKRGVQHAGFGGIQFKKDYCDDVEVIVPGADTSAIRSQLGKEADQVHVGISFEPPDILKRPDQDVVKAVFGLRPTLSRANRLQLDIAHVGFREGTDIERLALHSWRVVLYNVPVNGQQSFAAEAASVGYRVTFIPQ
jgi:hypothetical protein